MTIYGMAGVILNPGIDMAFDWIYQVKGESGSNVTKVSRLALSTISTFFAASAASWATTQALDLGKTFTYVDALEISGVSIGLLSAVILCCGGTAYLAAPSYVTAALSRVSSSATPPTAAQPGEIA